MTDKFEAKLGLNTKEYDSKLKGAGKGMESFGSIIKKIGGIIGVAFGVQAIISFSKESMRLAAEAEGVKTAFAKIGDSTRYMNEMMRVTRGAIENSDLMALAIKAKNFNIPLQDLSKYLEFATNRAIITGKSVNDLVELIVTGLGRKSSRSMIELGLSTDVVQEAFKTTGGFMALVTSELEKMGPVADTTAISMGKLSASVQNFKEAWGEWLNKGAIVKAVRNYFTILLTAFADESKPFLAKLKMLLPFYGDFGITKEQNNVPSMRGGLSQSSLDQLDKMFGGGKPTGSGIIPREIETITTLTEKLKGYKEDLDLANTSDKERIENLLILINRTEAYIKKLTELSGAITPAAIDQLKALPQRVSGSVFDKTWGMAPLISKKLAGPPAPGDQDIAKAMGESWQKAADEGLMMSGMEALQERLQEALSSMRDMAIDYGAQIAEAIGEVLGGGDVKEIGKGLLLSLANFLSQFGKMLIVAGFGIEAFADAMATGNAPLAIAAGVAMLVAAGAIRGMMSKAGSQGIMGGGGGGSQAMQPQTIKVIVEGKISGKDITISSRRYLEDNG